MNFPIWKILQNLDALSKTRQNYSGLIYPFISDWIKQVRAFAVHCWQSYGVTCLQVHILCDLLSNWHKCQVADISCPFARLGDGSPDLRDTIRRQNPDLNLVWHRERIYQSVPIFDRTLVQKRERLKCNTSATRAKRTIAHRQQ